MKKLLLIIVGVIYYFFIHVNILDLKDEQYTSNTFAFTIESHIPHVVKLYMGTNRFKVKSVVCAGVHKTFDNARRLWFEKKGGEEQIALRLGEGKVHCKAKVQNKGRHYIPSVKQKLTVLNYIVLFILIAYPLLTYIFSLFMYILDMLRNRVSLKHTINDVSIKEVKSLSGYILLGILFLGIGLRSAYYYKFGVTHFQHDWQGHIEFIKYISEYWTVPMPSKGLQFPQQPLYYYIAAGLYSLGLELGLYSMHAIHILGYFSLFCSFVFLWYSYKFFTCITQNRWVQIVAMLFVTFTPSIVYMSARINNDVLVMALSVYTLYYILRSYHTSFEQYFYRALLGVSLLFMTKVSAVPLEILFFLLLCMTYINEAQHSNTRKKLYIFSIVGIFLFGYTLLRVYLPVEGGFHFVNSSGSFLGQHIPKIDMQFMTYLNVEQLLNMEYIQSYFKDTSLYTFPNHQYRTMFIGEFNYERYVEHVEELKIIIQIIFLLGFVYILGFFAYFRYAITSRSIDKILILIVLFNLLLIFKFVFDYPSLCNTDFRYFVPTFPIIGYVFSQGLNVICFNPMMRYIISIVLGILIMGELAFIFLIIL